jgi:hypothetical protein
VAWATSIGNITLSGQVEQGERSPSRFDLRGNSVVMWLPVVRPNVVICVRSRVVGMADRRPILPRWVRSF